MPLEIAQLGQPVLRRKAAPISPDELRTPETQHLIDAMLETVQAAGGIGLAGPQVFQSKRLFVAGVLPCEDEEEIPAMEVFINPRLTPLTEELTWQWEGCLSFSELLVLLPRIAKIRVDYLDRHGNEKRLELEGYPARVVQHENDHLDGILTIDRAPTSRFIIKASELEAAQDDLEEVFRSSRTAADALRSEGGEDAEP